MLGPHFLHTGATDPTSADPPAASGFADQRPPFGPALHVRSSIRLTTLLALLLTATFCRGADLALELPADVSAKSAVATAEGLKLDVAGKIDGTKIIFPNVLPDTAYDIKLTLADGSVLQGVNLSWYTGEPPAKDAGPLSADDREQVRAIVQDIKDFYNKKVVLTLVGDHDRATAMVRLVRDTDFYAGKGQIIWRIELWYFKNEAGGWAAVGQQNKILRRERFKDAAEYQAATAAFKLVPALGGLKVVKSEQAKSIKLTRESIKPVQEPAEKAR